MDICTYFGDNSDDGRSFTNMKALLISVAIGFFFGLLMWLIIKWFDIDDD